MPLTMVLHGLDIPGVTMEEVLLLMLVVAEIFIMLAAAAGVMEVLVGLAEMVWLDLVMVLIQMAVVEEAQSLLILEKSLWAVVAAAETLTTQQQV
jgi:hypothetical protein